MKSLNNFLNNLALWCLGIAALKWLPIHHPRSSDTLGESLAGLKPIELVEKALEHHRFFKAALLELETSPVDETAAIRLIEAYQDLKVAPWAAALLLGRTSHRVGFETVKKILLDHPGRLAEDYAGVALARIVSTDATQDLLKIVLDKSHHIKTQGALHVRPTYARKSESYP